jgi:glycosyltransferase involved in cell wall biosynthesis
VPEKDGGSDNLPTVIIEAMLARTPVISTQLAGIPEMIVDGQDGLLVPPNDPGALAASMAKLLADAAGAENLGQKGRLSAQEKFAVEKTTSALKQLLVARALVTAPAAARSIDPSLPGPSVVTRLLQIFDK